MMMIDDEAETQKKDDQTRKKSDGSLDSLPTNEKLASKATLQEVYIHSIAAYHVHKPNAAARGAFLVTSISSFLQIILNYQDVLH